MKTRSSKTLCRQLRLATVVATRCASAPRARSFPSTNGARRPSLIVEPPLPGPMAGGRSCSSRYRGGEFCASCLWVGAAASNVSAAASGICTSTGRRTCLGRRADYGQSNTIILVGHAPGGQHQGSLIEVVDPEGNVFTKQAMTFHTPDKKVQP